MNNVCSEIRLIRLVYFARIAHDNDVRYDGIRDNPLGSGSLGGNDYLADNVTLKKLIRVRERH